MEDVLPRLCLFAEKRDNIDKINKTGKTKYQDEHKNGVIEFAMSTQIRDVFLSALVSLISFLLLRAIKLSVTILIIQLLKDAFTILMLQVNKYDDDNDDGKDDKNYDGWV